eukprot:Awhi_evm1s12254
MDSDYDESISTLTDTPTGEEIVVLPTWSDFAKSHPTHSSAMLEIMKPILTVVSCDMKLEVAPSSPGPCMSRFFILRKKALKQNYGTRSEAVKSIRRKGNSKKKKSNTAA